MSIRTLKRLFRILSSTKTTAVLLLIFIAVFLLGQWIPQKKVLGELYLQWLEKRPGLVAFLDYIGFTDIYSSPLVISLFLIFFLNLLSVMVQRTPIILERIRVPSTEDFNLSAYPFREEFLAKDIPSMEELKGLLRGYRIYGEERNFVAIKNRFSPLGTLLFHLSFFLLLTGSLLTTYTKFSATLDLAEGEFFSGMIEQYNNPRVSKFGRPPSVRFFVERIEPLYLNDIPLDLRVYIRDERGIQWIASINRPYKRDHTSFVVKNLGIAPLIILYDKEGKEIDGAYVKLDVFKGKIGRFNLGRRFFEVLFYPDFYQEGDEIGTRSDVVRNPVLSVTLRDKTRESALFRIGERKRLGEYELSIPELRYSVRFVVIRERGLWIVYTGFLLITIALIMRLVFYKREIRGFIVERDGRVFWNLGGRADFYRSLFEEEFKGIIKRLSGSTQQSS